LTTEYNRYLKDSLLNIKIYDDADSVWRNFKIPLEGKIVIIDVRGTDGVNGENAFDGVNGTDGFDGKDVFIYYSRSTEKYKSKVVVLNSGGRHGKGSKGGRKRIISNDQYVFVYGRNGTDGREGRKGNVHYILNN